MLRPCGDCGCTSTTVATVQSPTTAKCAPLPVPLFAPGVAVEVVAVLLPEAGLVVLHHREAAHPLRALPEVEVRHEQTRGAAVLGIEVLAVELERDPRLAVEEILERDVGR